MRLPAWLGPTLLPLCLLGCAGMFPAPTPMAAIDYKAGKESARCLIVFLPGRGDAAAYFEQRGFVGEVQRRKLSIDMVAANATLGYYFKGTLTQRLFTDVVRPRLWNDYKEIWLVGMSMGGLGTFMYSRQRPAGEVTGVLALAPYLGEDDLLQEIKAQGGLARWQPPPRAEPMNGQNYQSELWRWLKAVSEGREPGPILHLGYGRSDRLAFADSLLGAALPKAQVYTADGGHNWDTWRGLLQQFLDRSDLAKRCGPR